MLAEAYVIGSIVFSVIFVGLWSFSSQPSSTDEWPLLEESLRCPRCGAEMESVGGPGCLGSSICYVVPPILVLKCPQCGYEERSWA